MKKKKGIFTIFVLSIVSALIFWKRKEIQQKIQSFTDKTGNNKHEYIASESTNSNNQNVSYASQSASTGYSECTQFPLRRGCKGSKVLLLQKRLNTAFNSGLTEDGYFGPNTESALLKNGYTKTVSASDMTKLMSPLAKLRS